MVIDPGTVPDLLLYGDLDELGLTRYRFDRMLAEGVYERIAPGLFLRAGVADDATAAWIATAVKKPDATVCLMSALAFHELTDEIPTRTDIAFPRGTRPPNIALAPITWHQFDAATFTLGRARHALPGGVSIGMYSPERTIVDLFRLRHEVGSDVAISALKRWLGGRGNSPAALLDLAAAFPKARPALQDVLEVLL